MFTHLQTHSCYSLLYGVRRVDEIVDAAAAMGFYALALTDINNLYGMHDFTEACRKRGLRPIIGAELRTADDRAVVLARNREGFSRLTRLISARMRNADFSLPAGLSEGSDGLLVLTDTPRLLARLCGRVEELYAMVTPHSRRAEREARRRGIPLAACGDASFLSEDDHHVHRVLRAIAARGPLSSVRDEDCARSGSLLFGPDEADRLFDGLPEAIGNTEKIAALCTFDGSFEGFVFPPVLPGTGEPIKALRRAALDGAERRYGELSESVMERLEYELSIIEGKGFSSYFLAVAAIVARSSLTCGRGSAAASIVAYSLGITNVDPLRHHLYFERFLNPERLDPPDIDVDFAWDERDALIESVFREYGAGRSARVSTMAHFQGRSALRETARAYGIPEGEIGAVERRLAAPRASGAATGGGRTWDEIMRVARRITGLPRHLGVHVGGIVLTPGPVEDLAPVETANDGSTLLAWDKDGTEKAGLVKIDLLGNRSLAVVRDALLNLHGNGIDIDPLTWDPLNDTATQALLARGDSIGVFYVESPAMRQLQKKTGRGDFEHLVIHSSIIRPAANRFIAEYVSRLRGKEYAPLHPRLDRILAETYGIMCYQEDVSKVAVALAGFSDADADGLRKILTKKNRGEHLAAYRERFYKGALQNGVEAGAVDEIWSMIRSFDGYSFCKAHSASYAMVSFQSAYLKTHHPAEFMAAVLSNGGGYYSSGAYVNEACRMGLSVLHPDVNASALRYHGRGREIRVGLMAVGGLGSATLRSILQTRGKAGPFGSPDDFVARVSTGESEIVALVGAGAFDGLFGGVRRSLQLRTLLRLYASREETCQDDHTPVLFPAEKPLRPSLRPAAPSTEDLREEFRRLGFMCDHHPLELWKEALGRIPRAMGRELPGLIGTKVRLAGWPVTRKEILTARGDAMEFVSFEDETAIYETVLFPDEYRAFSHVLNDLRPYVIEGTVESDRGAVSLTVMRVRPLPGAKVPGPTRREPWRWDTARHHSPPGSG
ncbi:MAG TPA: DNA polymerase III subunit alpha [Spirochaetota bacterium]|nr:DNA polymerase III subunit alpha [Spirochaetota bacterium]